MANASQEKASLTALQRGKACLRCRKRKMRCDGAKPSCHQCSRAKRPSGASACEYDDGKGKTRTQILRETIAKLEQRVRELEDPEFVASSVTLYDPAPHCYSESPASSPGSSDRFLSASRSPFPSDCSASPSEPWSRMPGTSSPFLENFLPDVFYDAPRVGSHPPQDLSRTLVDIFAPHQRQCGLEIDIDQVRDSLHLPVSEQRHPVLMNAIYLWACFVSRHDPLCQQEDHYLRRSLDALPDALQNNDKIVDVVQASCMLSLYLFANGRFHEGGYHANAAAALAVQLGLHQKVSHASSDALHCQESNNDMRYAEKISAFWQAYNLDRRWSVILRKPCVIPDGPSMWNSVCCPWPRKLEDYCSGQIDGYPPRPTIKAFLAGEVSSCGFSVPAMSVKASTLYCEAEHLSRSWKGTTKVSGRLDDLLAFERSISLFLTTLVPVEQLCSVLPEDKPALVVAHTLAQAAIINLYGSHSEEDPLAFEKCSQAASSCVAVIKVIAEEDYAFLDPIIGPCWWAAAEILITEWNTLETSWPFVEPCALKNDLHSIQYAMSSLTTWCSVIGPILQKLQKRLL